MSFGLINKNILIEKSVIIPFVLSGIYQISAQSHVRRLVLYSTVQRLNRDYYSSSGVQGGAVASQLYFNSVRNFSHQYQNMPKRKYKNKNSNHPKKVQKFAHEKQFESVEYYFEKGLRKIKPYVYKFECHAKGRWFGSKLLDVFKKEFRLESAEYYETAIREGLIRVNRGMASPDRILKNNDFMQSKVHRHEPPVSGEPIQIIAETEHYLVINKPSSIPVHPCGKYRHNTIVFILGKDYGFKGLHTIHRLDRLTSGLLLFARTLEVSHRLDAYVRERKLEKVYVCKVQGEFPSDPVDCEEPIFIVSHKIGVCRVKADGKPCKTRFERLSYDGETSIVKCYPLTGRMHQIRVHLQYLGFPILNDPLYNNTVWGQQKGRGGIKDLSDEQLLKDLIDQHDIEIDSALERARLQTLLNKPKTPSPTKTDTVTLLDDPNNDISEDISRSPLRNSEDLGTSDERLPSTDEGKQLDVASVTTTDAQEKDSAMEEASVSHSRTEMIDCSLSGDSQKPIGSSTNVAREPTKTCPCNENDDSIAGNDLKPITGLSVDINSMSDIPEPAANPSPNVSRTSKEEACRSVSSEHDDATRQGKGVDDAEAVKAEVRKSSSAGNTSDDEERLVDEKTDRLAVKLCRECRDPMPDPEPEDMCIYLHALTYKGPDFEFSAPMPAWAQEHFERTGTNYS